MAEEPSACKTFNRTKIEFSIQYIEQLVRHAKKRGKFRKLEMFSHDNSSKYTLQQVRNKLMDMISTENNANFEQGCAFSYIVWSKTETGVRFLEDALNTIQKNTDNAEAAYGNTKDDEIIFGSLNQISQKFMLNERLGIAFKISGSYLLD